MKQFLGYQCLNREPLHQPCTAKTLQAGQAAHADRCPGLVGLKALPKRMTITIAGKLCTCSSWAFFSTDNKTTTTTRLLTSCARCTTNAVRNGDNIRPLGNVVLKPTAKQC